MSPEILHRQDTLVTGRWRNVYVESVRAPFDLELVRLTNTLQRAAAKQPGLGKMAVVTLFHHGLTLPNSEMRKVAEETMAAVTEFTVASAAVLLKPGFGSALFRTAFAGVSLVNPPPFPVTMVSTLPEACRFILQHVDRTPPLQALVDAVDAIHAAPAKPA